MASFGRSGSQILTELASSPSRDGKEREIPGSLLALGLHKRKFIVSSKDEEDANEFTHRLNSLKKMGMSYMLWTARISPCFVARYGWLCVERDLLQCVGCRVYLSCSLPSPADIHLWNEEKQMPRVDVLDEARAYFRAQASGLASIKVPSTTVPLSELDPEIGGEKARFLIKAEAEVLGEGGEGLAGLVIGGWGSWSGPLPDCLHCRLCLRTLHLPLFDPASRQGSSLQDSPLHGAPPAKAPRLDVEGKERVLHPLKQHESWCPWLESVSASAVLPFQEDENGPNTDPPRWRLLFDTLLRPSLLQHEQESDTPVQNVGVLVTQARQLMEETLPAVGGEEEPTASTETNGSAGNAPDPAPEPIPPSTEPQQHDVETPSMETTHPIAKHAPPLHQETLTESTTDEMIPDNAHNASLVAQEKPPAASQIQELAEKEPEVSPSDENASNPGMAADAEEEGGESAEESEAVMVEPNPSEAEPPEATGEAAESNVVYELAEKNEHSPDEEDEEDDVEEVEAEAVFGEPEEEEDDDEIQEVEADAEPVHLRVHPPLDMSPGPVEAEVSSTMAPGEALAVADEPEMEPWSLSEELTGADSSTGEGPPPQQSPIVLSSSSDIAIVPHEPESPSHLDLSGYTGTSDSRDADVSLDSEHNATIIRRPGTQSARDGEEVETGEASVELGTTSETGEDGTSSPGFLSSRDNVLELQRSDLESREPLETGEGREVAVEVAEAEGVPDLALLDVQNHEAHHQDYPHSANQDKIESGGFLKMGQMTGDESNDNDIVFVDSVPGE